jgi:hypothetical protein
MKPLYIFHGAVSDRDSDWGERGTPWHPERDDLKHVIEHFTEGSCWLLALAIERLFDFPIEILGRTAGGDDSCDHAVNRLPDGRLIDITGTHEEYELLVYWGAELITSEENLARLRAGLWWIPAEALPDEIIDTIARRVVEREYEKAST